MEKLSPSRSRTHPYILTASKSVWHCLKWDTSLLPCSRMVVMWPHVCLYRGSHAPIFTVIFWRSCNLIFSRNRSYSLAQACLPHPEPRVSDFSYSSSMTWRKSLSTQVRTTNTSMVVPGLSSLLDHQLALFFGLLCLWNEAQLHL